MDVVVVGSCNMDFIRYSRETVKGHKFTVGFGGKGSNQCIAAARLGAKTAMIAQVGNDKFGPDYIQNFRDNENVGLVGDTSTGVATITVDMDGKNTIVIVSGANDLLNEASVGQAENIIRSAKVMVCQLEISPKTTLAAMTLAKKHGVTTIFNPAPAMTSLDPQLFVQADITCPNESEAEMLTGEPVKSVEDAKKAVLSLLDMGCRAAIVTLGDQGAVLATATDRLPQHVPARKVKAVDTTGAGDAFVGALAFYRACYPNLALHECVERASEIATVSVQSPGTQTSYSYRRELPQTLF
ncbi:hypothetical protein NP493_734g02052 [Ridgeia piscesae]|uniref:Ribokinase n=1 Tax=Ridgeia piscesae TaxID=27915 RepID=A0AAD9KPR6_RIDPI|nr:hypothetical protein NP493_734g02052 [Ridgeia piscesae]